MRSSRVARKPVVRSAARVLVGRGVADAESWVALRGSWALGSVAGWTAGAVGARRDRGSPFVTAFRALPPELQAGSGARLNRIDPGIARGVKLGRHIWMFDGQ